MFKDKETGRTSWGKVTIASIASLVALVLACFLIGLVAGVISRYEKREDAKNEVTVTRTLIQKAEEEAKVNNAQIKATEAEARKRVAESIGLKKSQDEIKKTLTPLYVQHEYVQAIEEAAHSDSNTIEFIPVGPNGIPIVTTTGGHP